MYEPARTQILLPTTTGIVPWRAFGMGAIGSHNEVLGSVCAELHHAAIIRLTTSKMTYKQNDSNVARGGQIHITCTAWDCIDKWEQTVRFRTMQILAEH